MNASHLFERFICAYNPVTIAKNSECINTSNIDCCLIDDYVNPSDLWNKLIHAVFNANTGCNIFIDVGSRICPGEPVPYSASLALIASSLAIDVDLTTVDASPSSTIIIKVYSKNIRLTQNILNIVDFSKFNTRIASNIYCGTLNVRKPHDIPWVGQIMRTSQYIGDGKLDIVFTLAGADSSTDNEELRIALRSIDKHIKCLGNVYIVTEKLPDWVDNVHMIYARDVYTNNKDANLISKLLKASESSEVSDRFIYWSDDQVVTSDISLKTVVPVYNNRGINHFLNSTSRWGKRMLNTLELVRRNGGNASCNWDSHVPQPVDKHRFIDVMSRMPYTTLPGVCINTAYFGSIYEPPLIAQDSVKQTFEAAISGPIEFTKPYIGYNDKGYYSGLREVLLERFPDKCIYEK